MITLRRPSLAMVLPLSIALAACNGGASSTAAPSASAAAESASAAASATATAAAPAASAAASSAPSASADATARAATPEDAKVAAIPASASAAKGTPAAPHAATKGGTTLPAAPNGILPPGAADALVKVGGAPRVTLVDAGAEPRTPLAYHFKKGDKQPLRISLDMTMGMKSQQMAMPEMTLPRMAMRLGLTASDVKPSGEAKIDALLDAFTVEPQGQAQEAIASALRPSLDPMKGMKLSYWVAPNGHVRDLDVKLDNAPPQAQQALQGVSQSFESMTAPLPDDAVGVGARWEVLTRVTNGGADLVQKATYTLTKRDGAKASLGVVVDQLAARDTVQAPGLPPGVTAKLQHFSSSGAGTTEIETTSMAPSGGKLDVSSAMKLEVAQAGASAKPESIEVQTKLRVGFERPAK